MFGEEFPIRFIKIFVVICGRRRPKFSTIDIAFSLLPFEPIKNFKYSRCKKIYVQVNKRNSNKSIYRTIITLNDCRRFL